MNRKSTLVILILLVFGLIVVSIAGFVKLNQMNSANTTQEANRVDDYAYLTTRELKSLPGLPETIRIVPTGKVKEFKLEARETEWEVLPGVKTPAVAYNGKSPGPVIRVTEGDWVRVIIKNSLTEATSIHFHGVHLPNKQDGVPPFTQKEIAPGETFTYEFMAGHAGTYMYHPHINSVEQIDKGLYGALVIEPQNNSDQPNYDQDIVMVLGGWNIPSDTFDREALGGGDMPGHDMGKTKQTGNDDGTGNNDSMAMDYNFWTINGKAFPATEKIKVSQGARVRIRLINISNAAHPMHLHGTDFRIIAEDSHPSSDPKIVNTIDVAPGKTFDIDFIADNPGQWVLHCHELHHTENDGMEPGGLMTIIEYDGSKTKVESNNESPANAHSNM